MKDEAESGIIGNSSYDQGVETSAITRAGRLQRGPILSSQANLAGPYFGSLNPGAGFNFATLDVQACAQNLALILNNPACSCQESGLHLCFHNLLVNKRSPR